MTCPEGYYCSSVAVPAWILGAAILFLIVVFAALLVWSIVETRR